MILIRSLIFKYSLLPLTFYLIFISAQVPPTCQKYTLLQTLHSSFNSNINSLIYAENMNCTWEISPNPPPNSITLIFTSFLTQFKQDVLRIYSGPYITTGTSPSNMITEFSGSSLPPILKINTPSIFLQFTSDYIFCFYGFVVDYYAGYCQTSCGNGYCSVNQCICYPGWVGQDCSIQICQDNSSCNNRGICTSQGCKCDVGYYGATCNLSMCDPFNLYTQPSGIFSDHNGFGNYAPFVNCSWLIQVPNQIIVLHFLYFMTQLNIDVLQIWTDLPSLGGQLITKLSGFLQNIPPVISPTGKIYLNFETSSLIEYSGFSIHYSTISWNITYYPVCDFVNTYFSPPCNQDFCSNNCSFNGICSNNQCICDTNWIGSDCSILSSVPCYENLVFSDGEGEFGIVPFSNCSITIEANSSDSLLVRLYTPKAGSDSDLSLLIRDSIFRSNFNFNSGSFLPPIITTTNSISIVLNSSNVNNSFIHGFYTNYSCPNSCSGNGSCILGICKCFSGYGGNDCSSLVCTNDCNGNGVCSTNCNKYECTSICKCNLGYYGKDCSLTFCSGFTEVMLSSGVIVDHQIGANYYPNTSCSWLLISPTSSTISVFFIRFVLDHNSYITIYDGNSTSDPFLVHASGMWIPTPLQSTGKELLIVFSAGPTSYGGGFEIDFFSDNLCSSMCSGQGWCFNSTCICQGQFTGTYCNQLVIPDPIVINGFSVFYNLPVWTWKFYVLTVTQPWGELRFLNQKITAGGNPEFYIQYQDYPTLLNWWDFTFYSQSQELIVPTPPNGTWYLGVYSRKVDASWSTIINVTIQAGCINNCIGGGNCIDGLYCDCFVFSCSNAGDCTPSLYNCSNHGQCVDSNSCACSSGYYGPVCEFSKCAPECKNGGTCLGSNLCDCTGTGFGGPTCSDYYPPCNQTCQNGGVCSSPDVCDCTGTGYEGTTCEIPTCFPECNNGGTCINPNTCLCPQGFGGGSCSLVSSNDLAVKTFTLVAMATSIVCALLSFFAVIILIIAVRRKRIDPPFVGRAGLDELNDLT